MDDLNLSKAQRYAAMKKRLAETSESVAMSSMTEPVVSTSSIASISASSESIGRHPTFPFRQVAGTGSIVIVSKRPFKAETYQADETHVMLTHEGTSGLVVLLPDNETRTAVIQSECAFLAALALVNGVPEQPIGLLADGVIYKVVVTLSNKYSLLYLIYNGSTDLRSSLTTSGLSLACDEFTNSSQFLHVSRAALTFNDLEIAAEEPAPAELIQVINSFPGKIGIWADREAMAGPDTWALWPRTGEAWPDAWAAWRGCPAVNDKREVLDLPKPLEKTVDRIMMDARDPQLPGSTVSAALLAALGGPGPWRTHAVVTLPFFGERKRIIRINQDRKIKCQSEGDELAFAIDVINRNAMQGKIKT